MTGWRLESALSENSWRSHLRRAFLGRSWLSTWIDTGLFEQLNRCSGTMKILNLGSGVGLFDGYISPHLHMINMDLRFVPDVDLVADGHALPFADDSLDAVFSNAVLEHVERPWVVAREIWRVLKPGGRVFVNVPFLNVIHDRHDYFRFTDQGLDVLFADFQKIAGGVSAGPASFLGAFLVEYSLCVVPSNTARTWLRPALWLLLWPVKYLDFPIRGSAHLRVVADAFYFVGTKVAR